MPKTSSEQRKLRRTRRKKDTDLQQVDLQVLEDVYKRAKVRLDSVQQAERLLTGAAKTTLSGIGRQAILNWKPIEDRTYAPTPRSPNGEAPDRIPFRFKMSSLTYAQACERIYGRGISVTQVVEEALNRFAQTGS